MRFCGADGPPGLGDSPGEWTVRRGGRSARGERFARGGRSAGGQHVRLQAEHGARQGRLAAGRQLRDGPVLRLLPGAIDDVEVDVRAEVERAVLVAEPGGGRHVGEQVDVASGGALLREQAGRLLQRAPAGAADQPRAQALDAVEHGVALGHQVAAGPAGGQHGGGRARRQALRQLDGAVAGRVEPRRVPDAVVHAHRVVQHDGDGRGAGHTAVAGRRGPVPESRPRNQHGDQQDEGHPQQKQQQMLEPRAPEAAPPPQPDEAHRREPHDDRLLPPQQMDDEGRRGGGAEPEQRGCGGK